MRFKTLDVSLLDTSGSMAVVDEPSLNAFIKRTEVDNKWYTKPLYPLTIRKYVTFSETAMEVPSFSGVHFGGATNFYDGLCMALRLADESNYRKKDLTLITDDLYDLSDKTREKMAETSKKFDRLSLVLFASPLFSFEPNPLWAYADEIRIIHLNNRKTR
jgi:uncharacterized protein with von Willebrand factor type A (vWA) domain